MADPDVALTHARALALALTVLAAARLALAGTLGVVADEAYYWTWSRHLAAGYFDHPPAVAWMIAASDRLLPHGPLALRAAGVVLGVGALAALVPQVRHASLLIGVWAAMPLLSLGGLFATPDVPLLFGWSVGIAGALGGRWWLAGIGGGIAALSKLTGWGLWPLLLIAEPRAWRRMLPGMAITLLVALPNVVWLSANDFISARFQLAHGLAGRPGDTPGIGGAMRFLTGQAALATPVLFGATAWVWGMGWRGDRAQRIAWWTSAPVMLFFAWAATRSPAEANWAAPAWVGASVLLARSEGRVARAAWVGVGLAGLLSAVVVAHVFVPLLPVPSDPARRLGEGRTLAGSVEAWGIPDVLTERYQEAALLRWHADLDARALPDVGRPDQYDLWPSTPVGHALFVRPWRGGPRLPTDDICAWRGPSHDVVERDSAGDVSARWQVVEVRDCDPARRTPPP